MSGSRLINPSHYTCEKGSPLIWEIRPGKGFPPFPGFIAKKYYSQFGKIGRREFVRITTSTQVPKIFEKKI
jgi:hypothetical protein